MAESGLESGHSPSTLGVALQSLEGAVLGGLCERCRKDHLEAKSARLHGHCSLLLLD